MTKPVMLGDRIHKTILTLRNALGSTLERLGAWMTIRGRQLKQKPSCGGCQKRREMLNNLYRKKSK